MDSHQHRTPLRCVIVTGPTATGKTRLAVALARRFDGEIVSADSRQVYRTLDIGTGKDLEEYGTDKDTVPVHLIDVADPAEEYNLYRFVADAREALTAIACRGRLPIVAGGTPLYIKALIDGYALEGGERDSGLRGSLEHMTDEQLRDLLRREDPERYERSDLTQRPRIMRAIEIARSQQADDTPPPAPILDPLVIAPYYPRHLVHQRIEARLDHRLARGMIDEVQRVHDSGVSWERLEWLGLEYRWIARFLQGAITYEQMRETLLARIRRFCKSQDIWFRKLEREGRDIHWIPGGDIRKATDLVERFVNGEPMPCPELRLDNIRYGPRSN